jgi:hypothetical protein
MEPETNAGHKSRQGSNRRRESRLDVDGTAVLHLLNISVKMPGRILNLSMSGCGLRTNERFMLGIYRRVEVEFKLQGLPFRLAGVTQSVQGQNNVGIRFLDVSERKKGQLIELIKELDEYLKEQQEDEQG